MQEELNNQILIFEKDGKNIDVKIDNETIWLNSNQIGAIFDVDRSVIEKHIKNIYKELELDKNQVCAIFAHTASDGKTYQTNFFNLDMIISVGYRVNSQKATQFRIWANNVLKNYLTKGYVINEDKLLEIKSRFEDLQNTIKFLEEKSKNDNKLLDSGEILSLLSSYSNTLTYLEKFDKGTLEDKIGINGTYILEYSECKKVIIKIKENLISKREASELFGNEKDESFSGIIANIYQTFGGDELYEDINSKAAHLLYFIIKDHPFSDGNKRIGSFIFIYFLDKNDFLHKTTGEKKINDNALTTLALLVAESKPKEKETIIKLIKNLIS
ncbi:MAG: RhuM family protein [Candidatus Gracilibacteria bacterium]|nr:RhuM family protein [Candidatus Gracilibacteria bacterium]MDD2908183.1 RhuM family protein [Candidatus Gracilibacteria bacterium]